MVIEGQTTIIIIVVQSVTAGLAAFFGAFLRKYGENQSLKKDLRKLTEIVEKVKSDFTEQNEILKTKLGLISLYESEALKAKRQALMNTYETIQFWLSTCLSYEISSDEYKDTQKLKEAKKKLKEAKFHYDLAFGRLKLFFPDGDLTQLLKEATLEYLKLQHKIEEIIDKAWVVHGDLQKQGEKKTREILSGLFAEYRNYVLANYKQINSFLEQICKSVRTYLEDIGTDISLKSM